MDRLGSFLVGLVVGGVCLHVASNFYIVRDDNGTHMIPKLTAKLENPYYDVRDFQKSEWQQNRDLLLAVVNASRQKQNAADSRDLANLLGSNQTSQSEQLSPNSWER